MATNNDHQAQVDELNNLLNEVNENIVTALQYLRAWLPSYDDPRDGELYEATIEGHKALDTLAKALGVDKY